MQRAGSFLCTEKVDESVADDIRVRDGKVVLSVLDGEKCSIWHEFLNLRSISIWDGTICSALCLLLTN